MVSGRHVQGRDIGVFRVVSTFAFAEWVKQPCLRRSWYRGRDLNQRTIKYEAGMLSILPRFCQKSWMKERVFKLINWLGQLSKHRVIRNVMYRFRSLLCNHWVELIHPNFDTLSYNSILVSSATEARSMCASIVCCGLTHSFQCILTQTQLSVVHSLPVLQNLLCHT
jgi:hypothetical protein